MVMRKVFVHEDTTLDSLEVENIFRVECSAASHTKRRQDEVRTHTHWRELLQDLEEGKYTYTPLTHTR